MRLKAFTQLIRRWWWMAALYVIVGVVGSLVVSVLTTPVYVATTTLVVAQNAAAPDATDYTSLLSDGQLANTYSQLLHSHPLLKKVISSLSLKLTVQDLEKKLKTSVVADTQLVTLNIEDSSPGGAVAIANELVKQFSSEIAARRDGQFASTKTNLQRQLEKVQGEMSATQAQVTQLNDKTDDADMAEKERLQSLLEQYNTNYESFLKSYQDVRIAESASSSSLVAAEAQASDKPLRPRPLLDMLLAAIVGLVLSVGVAFFAEKLDDSVKSPEHISEAVGLTTLGIVSQIRDLSALDPFTALANPRSSVTEAYKMLRTNLEFTQLNHRARTLLIVSTKPGDGKSTAAANIAAGLAQSGKKVILVDADLCRPNLHNIFGLNTAVRGLTNVLLAGRGSASDYLLETGVEGLRLLPSGPLPPNSAELLQSRRMSDLIGELLSQADLIIFDSSALAGAADGALLAGLCDAVMLVAKAGSTRTGALLAAKEQLTQAGAHILGVLLNHVPTSHGSDYYYYDYGEGSGMTSAGSRAREAGFVSSPSPNSLLPSADGASFFARLKHLSGLSLTYVVADIISRGSAILLVPLYTRFMGPSDYGIIALASVIISLLIMLLSFGGPTVVQRFYHQYTDEQENERVRFLGGFWLFLIIVPGIVIGATLAFGGSVIGAVFNSLPLHPYVELILCIAYLNIAFGTVLPGVYRAREQAVRYLGLSAVTMLLTVAFTVYLVVFQRMGAVGALGAQFLALDVVAMLSSVILLRELIKGWFGRAAARNSEPASNAEQGRPLRRALKYGFPLIPHFAAHWTLSISDRAILERFVGLGSVGLYSLAYQFGTVLQMLITSVNQALTPSFSRAARDRREFAALGRIATYYYLVVAVLGLCIALTAKDIITLVTPREYHSAGGLVPYIALGIVAMGFYFIPMNALSMTAGKTNVIPFITLVAGATNVVANLVLVPRFGPLAAAIDTAVGYGLLAVLTTAYAQSVIRLNYEVGRIVKIAVASLAVYGAHFFVDTGSPVVNVLVSLLLIACLPMLLWALGFWTDSERAKLARLLRLPATPVRTIIPES